MFVVAVDIGSVDHCIVKVVEADGVDRLDHTLWVQQTDDPDAADAAVGASVLHKVADGAATKEVHQGSR